MKTIDVYCFYDLDCQIELIGTASGLADLAFAIGNPPCSVTLRSAPPSAYPGTLARVIVIESQGMVKVAAREDAVEISGGPVCLEYFACNFSYMADKVEHQLHDHLHVEYYPDHPYISQGALACIIGYIDAMPSTLSTENEEKVVYVRLLNEGTEVWTPIPALHIGGAVYQLLDKEPVNDDVERLEFPPDSLVVAENKVLSGGMRLVAVANAA